MLALDPGEDVRRLTTVIHLHGGGEEGIGEDPLPVSAWPIGFRRGE